MRVLVIATEPPYPTINGGRLRLYNLLKRIAGEHEVWLACHLYSPDHQEGIAHLKTFCQEVLTGSLPRQHPLVHLPGLMRYAMAGKPLELKFYHSSELVRLLQPLSGQVPFDIVQIEESLMALYLDDLPANLRRRSILTFYDVAFDMIARAAAIEQKPLTRVRRRLYSRMLSSWEPRYAGRFARCITVSDVDRQLLLNANPALQVDVIPNGVDTHLHQPLPQDGTSPNVLFIGNMSYRPCIDAVLYFAAEILPLLRQHIPETEFWVVGPNPSPEVKALEGNDVHVTGKVESILPYYRQSRVCVVPLRAGGGTRLKILEAMALGRPVVTTSIGHEGLDVADGEHLLVGDSPDSFAHHVLHLMADQALYERLTQRARLRVEKCYDWDNIARQQIGVYQRLITEQDETDEHR